MSASAPRAWRCAPPPPSTSRSGTSSARPSIGPMHQLLGGLSRQRDPHLQHLRRLHLQQERPAAVRSATHEVATEGPYEDQIAFNRDAGALAQSLLEEGITAMKIWPFDPYAVRERRQLHPPLRSRQGAAPVPPDPRRGRRPDGGHGRDALDVGPAVRPRDRPRAAGVPAVLGRGSDQDAGRRRARNLRGSARALPVCASETRRDALAVPRPAAQGRGRLRDARRLLVRRPVARRRRSPPWRRRSSGRSRRTTARGRWSSPPRSTSR